MEGRYERRYRLLVEHVRSRRRDRHALAERARATGDMAAFLRHDEAEFALTGVLAYVEGMEANG